MYFTDGAKREREKPSLDCPAICYAYTSFSLRALCLSTSANATDTADSRQEVRNTQLYDAAVYSFHQPL